MTDQQMPARIWATYDGGEWSTARLSNDRLFIRADIAERMAEALDGLVHINEEHNASIAQVIKTPADWKDTYLDAARSALSAFKSATQDTEARHD